MKPTLEQFKKLVRQANGNLSRVADELGVPRSTVESWKNSEPEYKRVVRDARMRLFDKCLITSEVLAMGIPIKDDEGKFIGWEEKPDGNMLRYLMGKLGVEEGFGDTPNGAQPIDSEEVEPSNISINVTYNEKKHLDLQGQESSEGGESKGE